MSILNTSKGKTTSWQITSNDTLAPTRSHLLTQHYLTQRNVLLHRQSPLLLLYHWKLFLPLRRIMIHLYHLLSRMTTKLSSLLTTACIPNIDTVHEDIMPQSHEGTAPPLGHRKKQ